jgi:hypothetical protein
MIHFSPHFGEKKKKKRRRENCTIGPCGFFYFLFNFYFYF